MTIFSQFARPCWLSLFLLLSFTKFVGAMEKNDNDRITQRTITSITELLELVPTNAKNVIVALDWDESTILDDGEDESGLREGVETKSVMDELLMRRANLFILTSRYKGSSLETINKEYIEQSCEFCAKKVARSMHKMSENMLDYYDLFPNSHQTFLFRDKDACCVELNDKKLELTTPRLDEDTALITPNIVFAGAHVEGQSNKGTVMALILDLHAEALALALGDSMFSNDQEITHVFFVDNDIDHIDAMVAAFLHRQEKLTVLYYPKKDEGK